MCSINSVINGSCESVFISVRRMIWPQPRDEEKQKLVFVFYRPTSSSPRLLPVHGECQRASERPGRRNKCSLETVAVISGGVLQPLPPRGLIRAFFFLAAGGRWIFSSRRSRRDVIVYYPAARVGKREWAGRLSWPPHSRLTS